MASYFQGAIKSGDGFSETSTGVGTAVPSQTALLTFTAESGGGDDNVDATLVLPVNAQIINIFVDTLTAWDSATSAGLTIGTAAGGTQLLGSSDVKSAGRETTAPTNTQLAVWDDIGTTNTVYIRVAQSGNTTGAKLASPSSTLAVPSNERGFGPFLWRDS